MKVLSLSADEGGCQFYRMSEPARVVSALGVDVEVSHSLDVDATQNTRTHMVEVNEIHTDADLIIIQRPLDNSFTSMIAQAKRQGIATIVELDDDFDNVSKYNVAYNGMYSYKHSGAYWVREACKIADHVTVSTPALEKYAPHKRTTVLRNCVPESYLSLGYTREFHYDEPTLGWTGSVQTHPHDLQVTKGAVAEIAKKNNIPFSVVGDGANVEKNLRLDPSTPFHYTGWVSTFEYIFSLAESMNMGIVPLELTNFNSSKSSIKGLEMASAGVPFVASPTREYLRLEAHGVGKIAKTPGDWRRHLQRWVDRPSQLERDAENYRDIILDMFTYEQNASDWLSVWEQTIAYRKSHHE